MTEDETTFLCGYKGLRRYGTTSSASAKRHNYSTIIKHRVLPSDTLQGIALKYGASTTEIKRLNKLWSNDSIHLRETLHIPILSVDASPSPTLREYSLDSRPTASGVLNGRDSCYDSMSENEEQQYYHRVDRKPSISEDDDGAVSCNSSTVPRGNVANSHFIHEQQKKKANNYDKSDCSINDLLNRIDSSIKLTASNVKRLEKQSTLDQILSDSDGGAATSMSASQSRHCVWETVSAGAPSPPEVRTEVRRPHGRYSMRKLQEVHDQLYQL